MRPFWVMWGYFTMLSGTILISLSWILHLWYLVIFNILITSLGVCGCYYMIKCEEERDAKKDPKDFPGPQA